MKTDVDTALKEIADWYVRNRQEITEPELKAILLKHCESEEEVQKFVKFLETEPGQLRFKTLLRERTGKPYLVVDAYYKGTSYLKDIREELPEKIRTYLSVYGDDIGYYENYITLSGRAYEKRDVILDYLQHWDKTHSYTPDFFAGMNRIEIRKLATSYLKEAPGYKGERVSDEECQIISPQYYDILPWLNIPVPDYSFSIEPETKERKIDQVLQKLKDGVARIHESAVFREFLITMAKFHDYSIGNQILIMLQRPTATRVAGIKTWNQLGRYVKRGEHGIAILAPCLPPRIILKCPICGRTFAERELRAHILESHPEADVAELVRRAREEMEAVIPTPTYFKVVYVFDVSQTEGKPLPEFVVPVLSGAYNRQLYNKLMKLAAKHGLSVSFESRPELGPEVKGMLYGSTIWIRPEEPEAQKLKTLAHELAHYFTEHVYFIPKAEAEVIAESVAFVVGAHFGFDTGTRSFPYVALWAKEKKVLEQNLASIRRISARMIDELGG